MADSSQACRPTRQPFFRILLSAGSVSLLSQGIALLRQVLVVSLFGFGRALDFYATLYALMSISVISLSSVLESNFIGLLNERKARDGEDAMHAGFGAYVVASVVMSVGLVGLLVLFYPLLSLPFTAGFSAAEKAEIEALALAFLPWALLVLPFAAMGACVKSAWHYRQFFTAELMVTLVSTGIIYLHHEQVADIAHAYAYGYGIAVLYLGWNLRRRLRLAAESFPWRHFLSRFLRHVGSNQVGTLYTMAERFWFSHLPAGGIATLGVVQQLTMSFTSLLSFRDAYLVPLADPTGRAQKIARLLCGLFLLSTAAATFVAIAAQPIGALLFQYGKAGGKDIDLLATLLAIGMVGVLMSTLGTPIWRVLQLGARYTPLVWLYLFSAGLTLATGYFFVGRLGLGAVGMAIVGAINATVAFLASVAYARSFGTRLSLAQVGLLLQSLAVFLAAALVSRLAMDGVTAGALVKLLCGGLIYAICLAGYAVVIRHRLRPLLKGTGLWAG
jgi:peptidoglycan biosynthesis protein MviN/MurJ (putative lipid II flippase)